MVENKKIEKTEKKRFKSRKRVCKNKKRNTKGVRHVAAAESAPSDALSPHPSDRWEAPEGALAN